MNEGRLEHYINTRPCFNATIPANKMGIIKDLVREKDSVIQVFGSDKLKYELAPLPWLYIYRSYRPTDWGWIKMCINERAWEDLPTSLRVLFLGIQGTNWNNIVRYEDFKNCLYEGLLVEHLTIASSMKHLNNKQKQWALKDIKHDSIKTRIQRLFKKC
jgi:hypothetical protein